MLYEITISKIYEELKEIFNYLKNKIKKLHLDRI